jgi:hypothetical protein
MIKIDENSCFDVNIQLESGCVILFVASVFYVISGTVVLRKCHLHLQERIEE